MGALLAKYCIKLRSHSLDSIFGGGGGVTNCLFSCCKEQRMSSPMKMKKKEREEKVIFLLQGSPAVQQHSRIFLLFFIFSNEAKFDFLHKLKSLQAKIINI